MKTTSVLTITAALSIGFLTLFNYHGREERAVPQKTTKGVIVSQPFNEDVIYSNLVSSKGEAGIPATVNVKVKNRTAATDTCGEEVNGAQDLCLSDIVYLETEEPVELGFDTDEYLPAGFDPYSSADADLNLDSIEYIEATEDIDLGFDTAAYLPLDFNPYAGMEIDLSEIVFIEEEAPIDLGFDTSKYLPEGFNPYAQPELCLDDIPYLEMEEEIDLGFDVNAYLPADFDPYAAPEFNLDQIPFMEPEDDIELWLQKNTTVTGNALNF